MSRTVIDEYQRNIELINRSNSVYVRQRFEQIGVLAAYLTPAKTQELLQSDFTGWGKVVKDNQLTPE